MNEANLTPRALTSEEARAIGRKGGVASGIARRRRRQMRELLGELMTTPVPDEQIQSVLEGSGLDASFENAISFAMLLRAARGDVEAARFVRDSLGEKPTETYNLSVGQQPIQAMDLSKLSDAELEYLADQISEETDG